ncbi:hypothetical protein QPK87_01995 [Kamptonema cortianum]|nr:hypothetical protein [Kamptonema cortianum]
MKKSKRAEQVCAAKPMAFDVGGDEAAGCRLHFLSCQRNLPWYQSVTRGA